MKGQQWFGKLEFTFQFLIVFGGCLIITLGVGAAKALYNRRKLKRLIAEMEEQEGLRSDEEDLNMQEKGEGDLFGIRALEAGFFGGVTQSLPASLASSLANSPLGTPRSRSPISCRRNSLSRDTSPMSATNNVLRISNVERQSPTDTIEAIQSARSQSNLRITSYAYDEDLQSQASLPSKPKPAVRGIIGNHLQPSYAELDDRINHEVSFDMSLEVLPFPGRASFRPPSTSLTPKSSFPESKKSDGSSSRLSTAWHSPSSSVSSHRQSVSAHYAPPQLSPSENSSNAKLPQTQNERSRNQLPIEFTPTTNHKPRTHLPGSPVTVDTSRPRNSLSTMEIPSLERMPIQSTSLPKPSIPLYERKNPQPALPSTIESNHTRENIPAEPSRSPFEDSFAISSPAEDDVDDTANSVSVYDDEDEGEDRSTVWPESPRTSLSFARTDPVYTGEAVWRATEQRPMTRLGESVPLSGMGRRGLQRPIAPVWGRPVGVYVPRGA